MKQWENPKVWELSTEDTKGTLNGGEEDHILVGDHIYGSKS
ncbi:hypothetical protein [Clostridium sp.]